jgi:hypothetical protein
MITQDVQIDYDYFENGQCSFEDLKNASNKLSAATQEQFEEIKNEKWFTRVFDMITLSKKNEKRLANQIGNLTQAQQIMMEIFIRLSARDQRVLDLVSECFYKLEVLSQNDIKLADKFRQLENSCILGIGKQTDLANLSEVERIILAGLIYELMKRFGSVSDAQRNYANNLLYYLEIDANPIDVKKSLDSVKNIDSKKNLLICCMEYGFLNELNFNFLEDVEEFVTEFDFGNKTIKEIKNRITTAYNLRGVDGFKIGRASCRERV